MKVTKPGVLTFVGGARLIAVDWNYVLEPGETYTTRDSIECKRAQLAAALDYIARVHGLDVPTERITLEVERAAFDAIAIARWSPQ